MNRCILFLALCIIAQTSWSQPLRSVTYEMMIETAEEQLALGNLYDALDWYEQAYDENREDDLAYQIAWLNYQLRDFRRAETLFDRLLRRDREGKYPLARYYLAKSLKINGKPEDAIEHFNSVITETSDPEIRRDCQNELQGVGLMDKLEDNLELSVVNIGRQLNSYYTESSPSMDAQGNLYFSSFQRRDLIVADGEEEDYHAKIHTSTRDESTKRWEDPQALDKSINREGVHNGNVFVSRDGNRMYLTRFHFEHNTLRETRIYMSTRNGNAWSPPQELQGINGNYFSKQPVEGELLGNRVLFFTANIDGGYGGYDLYYATPTGQYSYSTPVNLGAEINTAADDISPFYTDGTLYFSSAGHPGLGGLDIYKSQWDGTRWSNPENIGRGYNTSFDEYDFIYSGDGTSGFLVSNRPDRTARSIKYKTCCDDLYYFTINPIQIQLLTGVFGEDGPLFGASVTLLEMLEETASNATQQTNADGNAFTFRLGIDRAYNVQVEREGYFPDSFSVNTVGIVEDNTIQKNVTLRPMPVEPDVEIITINEPIRLNNIYYEFDDDQILPESEGDLNILLELMNQYENMVIELSAHTDARGRDRYNEDLSQRRAESAKRWLVTRGISARRIRAVGYGEEQILNGCEDGVRCTEEEHQFNRRTEFKIIEGPTSIEVRREVIRGKGTNSENQPDKNKDNPRPDEGGSDFMPQDEGMDDGTPAFKFKRKFIDFGEVALGVEEIRDFEFTNVGDADLVIDMATACECTELEWPMKAIQPGERGFIRARYKSEDKLGEQEVTIDILANTHPILTELRFRVFVQDPD